MIFICSEIILFTTPMNLKSRKSTTLYITSLTVVLVKILFLFVQIHSDLYCTNIELKRASANQPFIRYIVNIIILIAHSNDSNGIKFACKRILHFIIKIIVLFYIFYLIENWNFLTILYGKRFLIIITTGC